MFEKKYICKTLEKVDRTQNINHICILNFFGIRTDPQAIIEQEVVLFFMCLCNFLLQILL